MKKNYFIRHCGRYIERGSWEGRVRYTDDPDSAVWIGEAESHWFAKRIGLGHYELVDAAPILAAHRKAIREKRAKAKRVAQALAAALRRRFPSLIVHLGGKTERELRVTMEGLSIVKFYVNLDAEIGVIADLAQGRAGGIESAIWLTTERLDQIRTAAINALGVVSSQADGGCTA